MTLCSQPLLGIDKQNLDPDGHQVYAQQQQIHPGQILAPEPPQSRALESDTVGNTQSTENQFDRLSEDINLNVLSYCALDHYYLNGHTKELASVCKNWHRLINNKHLQKDCQKTIFSNGKFTYVSDQGLTILQFIKDHPELYEITFNLQQRADANRRCVFTTNPSVFFKESDVPLKILIVTRSFAEESLDSTMHHFAPIMPEWNKSGAAIGYFFKRYSEMNPWPSGSFVYCINNVGKLIREAGSLHNIGMVMYGWYSRSAITSVGQVRGLLSERSGDFKFIF